MAAAVHKLGKLGKTENESFHELPGNWTLWAHLPHDTDWTIKSYQQVQQEICTVEMALTITETIPDVVVKNCMLFLMKDGVKPIWEDENNRQGGCFSYKIPNKSVYDVWKQLSYVLVGGTISSDNNFTKNVTGITISPKKNFCIIKVWMSSCEFQNATLITNIINGIAPAGCIFKKHTPEY